MNTRLLATTWLLLAGGCAMASDTEPRPIESLAQSLETFEPVADGESQALGNESAADWVIGTEQLPATRLPTGKEEAVELGAGESLTDLVFDPSEVQPCTCPNLAPGAASDTAKQATLHKLRARGSRSKAHAIRRTCDAMVRTAGGKACRSCQPCETCLVNSARVLFRISTEYRPGSVTVVSAPRIFDESNRLLWSSTATLDRTTLYAANLPAASLAQATQISFAVGDRLRTDLQPLDRR